MSGNALTTLSRNEVYKKEYMDILLSNTRLYGRMNPEDKKSLIKLEQRNGDWILFCGDGANDCAALESADVGISLTDSEASAAAPFTATHSGGFITLSSFFSFSFFFFIH